MHHFSNHALDPSCLYLTWKVKFETPEEIGPLLRGDCVLRHLPLSHSMAWRERRPSWTADCASTDRPLSIARAWGGEEQGGSYQHVLN